MPSHATIENCALFGVASFFSYSLYHELCSRYWHSSLIEADKNLYPTNVLHRAADVRPVYDVDASTSASASPKPKQPPQMKKNIGLKVQGPVFSDAETVLLYRMLKDFVTEHGSDHSFKYRNGTAYALADAGLDATILDGARVFSPFSVENTEFIPNRKVFSGGDAMKWDRVPSFIRYLTGELRKTHPVSLGRVREVMIEHFPSGAPFCHPRPLPQFAGYDYFVFPIRAPAVRDEPFVMTLTPALRSKSSDLAHIARHSWTNRDVDALLERGCVAHVHSHARMEWRFAVRPPLPAMLPQGGGGEEGGGGVRTPVVPLQWFGSPANIISRTAVEAVRPWWQRVVPSFATAPLDSWRPRPSPPGLEEDRGIVLVTVGFSGAEVSERRISGMPEHIYFGLRPPDARQKWDDDGHQLWAPVDWSEINCLADLRDLAKRRLGSLTTRNPIARQIEGI